MGDSMEDPHTVSVYLTTLLAAAKRGEQPPVAPA